MQMLQSDGVVSIHRLTWRSNCSLERGGNEIEKSEISSRLILYVWCTPFVDGWYFMDYSHIHERLQTLVGPLYPSHHHSCFRFGEQWPTSSMDTINFMQIYIAILKCFQDHHFTPLLEDKIWWRQFIANRVTNSRIFEAFFNFVQQIRIHAHVILSRYRYVIWIPFLSEK